MLRLLAFVPVAALLGGCQMTAQRPAEPQRIYTSLPAETVPAAPRSKKGAVATLPPVGKDGTRIVRVGGAKRNPDGMVGDRQLAAELNAIIKRSKASGGPSYAIASPACIVSPELQKELKTKESVCYAADEAGSVPSKAP